MAGQPSLYSRLLNSIMLDREKKENFTQGVLDGSLFYKNFNDSRMKLAFDTFSEDMKKALYEVIYFLHVNDPKYAAHTYEAIKKERVNGVLREVTYETTANLYVKDSPSGVVGIGSLSELYAEDFKAYVKETFGEDVSEKEGFSPIYSIASLGSIGTIGHKKLKSDLDLQVQYELEPFVIPKKQLSDLHLKSYLQKLNQFYAKRYVSLKKWKPDALADPVKKKEALTAGRKTVLKKFPLLFPALYNSNNESLKKALLNAKRRQQLAHELIELVKLYSTVFMKKQQNLLEKHLKDKILKVQDYVQRKFPNAEIYLFAYSNEDYRNGNHGTTLDSKESSGSAYELILNYDVLMPGIQFSPMIPTHFLMTKEVNASPQLYSRLMDYVRFGMVSIYDRYKHRMVNLGATLPLTTEYMTAHKGAVYWESFKASSGNLPKALLNLFRIEMLFHEDFQVSTIELIKEPESLDNFLPLLGTQNEDDEDDEFGLNDEEEESMSLVKIMQLEKDFPQLLQDPWWLRYKALKIGFSEEREDLDQDEVHLTSKIIDLCFALHVRISDVFVKPGEKKDFSTHREQVLVSFLEKAFPLFSPQREFIQHIFIGEVKAINQFETEMKMLFKNSLQRTLKIVEKQPKQAASNEDEFKIWYHYYQQNFEPKENVVSKSILTHLKVARGRLQIGFKDSKWFFRSLQKQASVGKRFDTFGMLDYLPDEVDLFEHSSFLHGIANCIQNGYYGVLDKGTLKETTTVIEFAVGKMDLGNKFSNDYAYIRPDDVARMIEKINKSFDYQEYDFRDCIRKDKEITDIFFFLNLLEYGNLSILYRDNLRNWYVDNFSHPKLGAKAAQFKQKYTDMFKDKEIHTTIGRFLKDMNIKLDTNMESKVNCWINPHAFETGHAPNQTDRKEAELSAKFKSVIMQIHGDKIELDEDE